MLFHLRQKSPQQLQLTVFTSSKPQSIAIIHIASSAEATASFPVYIELLCRHSAVLAEYTNLGIISSGRELQLENVEPLIFGLMIHWMYTGDIENVKGHLLITLAKLFNLAFEYEIEELVEETFAEICLAVTKVNPDGNEMEEFTGYVANTWFLDYVTHPENKEMYEKAFHYRTNSEGR